MSWNDLQVASGHTYHITRDGRPAYTERFDEVQKYHAPGLAPVTIGLRAWHILADGSPAYAHRFHRTFGFYEGISAVVADEGWYHITPNGQALYSERYAWCGNFQGGRCTVRKIDGTYTHIMSDGQIVYKDRWHYAGDYRDGIAVVQASDGRSTHVDIGGHLVHGRWFIDLDVFHKNYARARDEDGWTHVDQRGEPTYTRRFAAVEPFYNGQARVERFDGALEVIDETGTMVVELRPPRRSEFSQLSEDMVGFWRTQTIGAAVNLGVFEALPASEVEVAERCGLFPVRVRRLLSALGELHLVSFIYDRWELTTRGEFLRSDHPNTLAYAALEYAGPLSDMWGSLAEAFRADSTWNAPDVFGQVAQDSERCESHHRMLRSYARHDYRDIVHVLDLQDGDHIIDAGGGLGTLAELVLEGNSSTFVTVLDRPEVIELGRREVHSPRINWHAANIFEPWGLKADTILLSRVLHDWDDESALQILSQARAALSPRGRIFIVEMLMHEGKRAGSLCDLHLLVATGGRERTIKDFERLLLSAGFELAGVRTVTALPSVVVGVLS